jgi:hypothetical protein
MPTPVPILAAALHVHQILEGTDKVMRVIVSREVFWQ